MFREKNKKGIKFGILTCLIVLITPIYVYRDVFLSLYTKEINEKPYETNLIRENVNCLNKCPKTKYDSIFLDHGIFAISINKETKFANFAAYRLSKENVNGKYKTRRWIQDPLLPNQIGLIPSDYKNANKICNYDRGHLVPLADFNNNSIAYKTNYLSNITPQNSNLNRGTWNDLEKSERNLLNKFSEVYILVGVYFNNKEINEEICYWNKNPRIKYKIPSGYFKIIMLPMKEKIIIASFIFPQATKIKDSYCKYKSSIEDIENLTNLDFSIDKNKINYSYGYLGCN